MRRRTIARITAVGLAALATLAVGCSSSSAPGADAPVTTRVTVAPGGFDPARATAGLLLTADQIGAGFAPTRGVLSPFFGDYESMVNAETTSNSLATSSGGSVPPANALPDQLFGKAGRVTGTSGCPLDLPEALAVGTTTFVRGQPPQPDTAFVGVWVYPDAATAQQAAAHMQAAAKQAADPSSPCAPSTTSASASASPSAAPVVDEACGVGDSCVAVTGAPGARCLADDSTPTTVTRCTTADTATVAKGNVVVTVDLERWGGAAPVPATEIASRQLAKLA
jgi:hypothetical protein